MFEHLARALPMDSRVSRNTYWRGLAMSQKKKGSKNLGLWDCVERVLALGFPLDAYQQQVLDSIRGLVRLLNKSLTIQCHEDVLSTQRIFR